jgi:hypothetical protein
MPSRRRLRNASVDHIGVGVVRITLSVAASPHAASSLRFRARCNELKEG